jgi:hypothetical protein
MHRDYRGVAGSTQICGRTVKLSIECINSELLKGICA